MVVTVVIPTWQRAAWLQRCLDGLRAQERVPDEVIVVGRAEDVQTKALFGEGRDWTPLNVRWVDVDRPGHMAPVQRALGLAKGDVIAFLDDDAEPASSWLGYLIAPFVHSDVAAVGGQVISAAVDAGLKVPRDAGQIRWYGKLPGNLGARADLVEVEVDGAMEGNCAWRASVLRTLDFDPALDFDDASMYGLDLCLQAKESGHRVLYQSLARVLHHAAPRTHDLDRTDRPARTVAFSRNYTYIALKHFRGLRRVSFVVWWTLIGDRGSYGPVSAVADVLLRRPPSPAIVGSALKGKIEGFRLWRSQVSPPRSRGSTRP